MEYRLLEKTELWIRPVTLDGADLDACGRAVGQVLGLGPKDIMVTDAIDDRLTLDILTPIVRAEDIVAKQTQVLAALAEVPGVTIDDRTGVHSEGILGLIGLEPEEGKAVLARSAAMGDRIAERISRRALILATGKEVLSGQIKDTNTPFLMANLRQEGLTVEKGPVLPDSVDHLTGAMRAASDKGYGLVVSTGGIGAEGKDQTLEALVRLDPNAFTPYVLKFHQGHGRHQKDGVRIGVGQYGFTRIVCLPGPHDEVELLWPSLKQALEDKWTNDRLAGALAVALRKKFLNKHHHQPEVTEEVFLHEMNHSGPKHP